ncbi:inorganic phosphate cotransporter [Trichonephila inaurata madagascariensis]|uniref:Inorganic phosphate cotransporter n=1 Tax=Trichonephila inaurata madagascariensis TaxID=2747483 RepID=A0A8X7C4Z0_9ARAC|nr:inorganic phosphate cotransporter [Trichonephila inaurata madagascariensis]
MKKEVNNFGDSQNGSEKKQVDGNVLKLEFLPSTPEKSQYLNGSTDKMGAKIPEPENSIFQCRYLVVLLDFFVFCEINAYALGTSISVVAMVNNTAVNSQTHSNTTAISCPVNTTDSDGHQFRENDGEFDWSPAIQGYVLGAGFLGYVITQMPGGLLAQTYGAKTTLICGLLLSSIAHVLSPFAAWTSSYLMMLVQFLRGFGQRPPIPWKKIFTSGPVFALVYAVFATYWIGAHFLSVQPIFLGTILRFSIQETGIFTSLPFIFQSIFVYGGGWVSSWLNKHNYVGVDKVRKGCNFLCCLGYSLGLLGVYFSGCDRWTSAVLSVAAMSFNGFSSTGCMITPVDMSPTFAGMVLHFN